MAVYPERRRAIRRNLARVTGRSERSWAVRRATSRMLRHFAFYWVDLFRFAQLPPEEGRRLMVGVDGLDELEKLRTDELGVILLTGHIGNWELGGVLLGQRDLPVSVVYVADRFAPAEQFRSRLRRQGGVEEIEVSLTDSWSSLPVLRALRQGRLVAMQGDRDFDNQGHVEMLFGAPVPFPRGPFLVALLTGAPIVPTFLTYTDDYRFEARFGEPIRLAATGDREADLRAGVACWARALEAVIRDVPHQWYTFYDYWSDVAETSSADRPRPPEVIS